MKASARNRFDGVVGHVRRGSVHDEVELEIADGVQVVATVTHESVDALGLRPGAAAFALVKASWIVVATDTYGVQLSARNQWPGKVLRVVTGMVNSEVVTRVVGGFEVVAVVTNDSVAHLALVPGTTVIALFKASSVVLGVAA